MVGISTIVGTFGSNHNFRYCLVVLDEHHQLLEELCLLVAAQLDGCGLLVDDRLYLVCGQVAVPFKNLILNYLQQWELFGLVLYLILCR